MRGALARSSSAASGFFFWGMIDEPLVQASGRSTKPNSCERPQHELRPEARQVRRAGRRGAQVVQDEVAVGDRVDRVGRDALEAELGRHGAAIGGEVDPRQRPGAERQRRRLLGGEAQPRAVALEHPHVGEQVMAQVDRLGALQVRVARQRPVEVALGGVDQRRHEPGHGAGARQCGLAREERDVGRHLVVARARGVQPPAHRARDLGEPPLDGHVDVLVVGREREAPVAQLRPRPRPGRPAARRDPRPTSDPLRGEHPRVRARLRDVVGPQAPVEADRTVEGLEGGILGLAEAGHAGGAASAALRPSAIWATWVASAKPSRYSVMARPSQAPVPGVEAPVAIAPVLDHHGHEADRPSAMSTHGDQPVMRY